MVDEVAITALILLPNMAGTLQELTGRPKIWPRFIPRIVAIHSAFSIYGSL